MRRRKLPFRMEHWQFISLCLTAYDAIAIAFSYIFALLIRFDFQFSQIPQEYFACYRKFIPVYIIICLIVFRIMRLYRSIWRFASIRELENVFFATAVTVPLHIVLTVFFCAEDADFLLYGRRNHAVRDGSCNPVFLSFCSVGEISQNQKRGGCNAHHADWSRTGGADDPSRYSEAEGDKRTGCMHH